jgi:hypothetical protein
MNETQTEESLTPPNNTTTNNESNANDSIKEEFKGGTIDINSNDFVEQYKKEMMECRSLKDDQIDDYLNKKVSDIRQTYNQYKNAQKEKSTNTQTVDSSVNNKGISSRRRYFSENDIKSIVSQEVQQALNTNNIYNEVNDHISKSLNEKENAIFSVLQKEAENNVDVKNYLEGMRERTRNEFNFSRGDELLKNSADVFKFYLNKAADTYKPLIEKNIEQNNRASSNSQANLVRRRGETLNQYYSRLGSI